MKNYLLILAVLVAFIPSSAFAQLRSKSEIRPKTEIISAYGTTQLLKTGTKYDIYISSSNRFDSTDFICLGTNAKSALTTMLDILNLLNNMKNGEKVTVEDAAGSNIHLFKYTKSSFRVTFTLQAGDRYLMRKAMQEFIKVLAQEYKNEMENQSNSSEQ